MIEIKNRKTMERVKWSEVSINHERGSNRRISKSMIYLFYGGLYLLILFFKNYCYFTCKRFIFLLFHFYIYSKCSNLFQQEFKVAESLKHLKINEVKIFYNIK